MDGYWQTLPSPNMKAAILADWMDDLEDWTIDQIRFALRKWRKSNPSKKPNPGHISTLLLAERGFAWADQKSGKNPDPVFAIENYSRLIAHKEQPHD